MHHKETAYHGLIANRERVMRRFNLGWIDHTPPSEHYPHRYKWDEAFSIEIYVEAARFFAGQAALCRQGLDEYAAVSEQKRMAKIEGFDKLEQAAARRAVASSFSLFSGQKPDGMIPNTHFVSNGRDRDAERRLAFELDATGSNYDQPPVTAVPVLHAYELMLDSHNQKAELFLGEIYAPLKKSFEFWENVRSNDTDDKLIGVIHPHETGRDSDPTFDHLKPLRLARKGANTSRIVDTMNIGIDYVHVLKHGMDLKRAGGDVAKQRELFWVNDVMMNCIYVDNLLAMADLGEHAAKTEDAEHYRELAAQVEKQIINNMYSESDGVFYALDERGEHIKEISISNLFPLLLPNLPPQQLQATLDLMDQSFNTPYPLPSVATTSPNYDPHNQEKQRLWRGPTWINTNWYLAERGMMVQMQRRDLPDELKFRCRQWAERVTISSFKLVEQNGACEFYDSETGTGQRLHVKNFGWSYLALTMSMLSELGLYDVAQTN